MSLSDSEEETNVYCSVSEALKLITVPFSGKRESLDEFIANVDSAFELVNPAKHGILLKFVKARITAEARSRLLVRNVTSTWEDVKQILIENYSVRRTTDFYACQLFQARQSKTESIANWASRIDKLQSQLREVVARVLDDTKVPGALALVELLAKASFIQGLSNDRIQLVIRSKSDEETTLGSLIELALEEETQISSHSSHPFAMQKQTPSQRKSVICFSCRRPGHTQLECRAFRRNKNFSGNKAKGAHFCSTFPENQENGTGCTKINGAQCNFCELGEPIRCCFNGNPKGGKPLDERDMGSRNCFGAREDSRVIRTDAFEEVIQADGLEGRDNLHCCNVIQANGLEGRDNLHLCKSVIQAKGLEGRKTLHCCSSSNNDVSTHRDECRDGTRQKSLRRGSTFPTCSTVYSRDNGKKTGNV